MGALKKHGASRQEYAGRFLALLERRRAKEKLDKGLIAGPTELLCSENTAEHYRHRRPVLWYLDARWGGIGIVRPRGR